MNILKVHLKIQLASGFLLLLSLYSASSSSEDVEVYQGNAIGIRPNVVFAIDTSRSMTLWVDEEDDTAYDANTTYPDKGFSRDRYYYSTDSNADYSTDGLDANYFHPNALVCNNTQNLISEGTTSGSFLRWNTRYSYWQTPGNDSGTMDTNSIIECKSDEGRHPSNKYVNAYSDRDSNKYSSKPRKWWEKREYNRLWNYPIRKIFTGNYLNHQAQKAESNSSSVRSTRISITKKAVNHIINTINGIRIGLMRFSANNEGGFVDIAVDDIEDIRDQFNQKVNSYFAWGGTPLTETYYEAAAYMRGDNVKFGLNSTSVRLIDENTTLYRDVPGGMVNYRQPGLETITTTSTNSARTSSSSSKYASPITNACQSDNSIVLFTDGEPSPGYDDSSNDKIRKLIADIEFPNDPGDSMPLTKDCTGDGGCADELAYFLYNVDQNPNLPGIQRVRTYVVGGFLDGGYAERLMRSIAKHGHGEYYPADSYDTIVDALGKSIGSVADIPATFVAPAISANSYNSLEHLDELYYAIFEPSGSKKWKGNLKSYRLSGDGKVLDSKGDSAVDTNGLFDEASRSYWTEESILDGAKVTLGGAASLLTANKNIFTHLSNVTNSRLTTTLTKSNISKSLLGLPNNTSDEEYQAVLDWGNRIDSADPNASRLEMEDPLHSRPVVINYETSRDSTGNLTTKSVVFVATNSGYLHAFKADKNQFKEYFSFIPKELLPNLASYKNGADSPGKVYGLDGSISYWHEDSNRNSIVDNNEKVMLFVGMRRGGRNYYALDISDITKPKFAWQITGGSGDFSQLGQTWSSMTLAKVPWESGHKIVLLFGGGYDSTEDNLTQFNEHAMGNTLYMVDASNGELLWQASKSGADFNHNKMQSSFVTDVRTIDYDGDRVTDFFYITDVGGKIWRFDINSSTLNANDFADGGIIFDANGDSGGPYQRFFNSPSVSYFKDSDGGYLTISVGTGFRAHPLQATPTDTFYIIKDRHIAQPPISYTTATPSLLAEIDVSNTEEQVKLGWKFLLAGSSEKVLANALTANDTIYFTSFEPTSNNADSDSCSAGAGTARAYSIKIQDNPLDPIVLTKLPPMKTPIPPAAPILLLTTKSGDEAFCEENPTHENCKEDPKDQCETNGAVILSGAETIGGGVTRCELLKKTYWLEN